MIHIKELFSSEQQSEIIKTIKEAEQSTSGEIRLYVEDVCKEDVLDRASFLFEKLQMHKTSLRNGVLFYLAIKDHKFAIIGDAGINKVVPPNFWDKIKEEMLTHFKNKAFSNGLKKGIKMAGETLKHNFPYHRTDKNELSDDIVFGK